MKSCIQFGTDPFLLCRSGTHSFSEKGLEKEITQVAGFMVKLRFLKQEANVQEWCETVVE